MRVPAFLRSNVFCAVERRGVSYVIFERRALLVIGAHLTLKTACCHQEPGFLAVCIRTVGRIMGVDSGAKDDLSRPRKRRRQHEGRDRASQTRLKKEVLHLPWRLLTPDTRRPTASPATSEGQCPRGQGTGLACIRTRAPIGLEV
jgi:hypothetical protein